MPSSALKKKGLLLDVHSRAPAAAGQTRAKRSGMDEGVGPREDRAPGWSALRLCNLVAQSTRPAEGRLPTGSGEGTDRTGRGAVGADLLQGLQEPDSGDRAGD